jgi:GT2 family glycosyltransferase
VPEKAGIPDDAFHIISDHIRKNPDIKIFYGDHDYLNPLDGKRHSPDFKPHKLDLHMLFSRDYLSQALIVRRSVLEDSTIGNVVDEGVLYAFALNAGIRQQRIGHIPHILATIKGIDATEMLKSADDKLNILNDSLHFLHLRDHETVLRAVKNPQLPVLRHVSYAHNAKAHNFPKVSIIIPCKNNVEMLAPCISTILTMSTYPNYEIILMDNGSTRQEMLDYQASLNDPRVRKFSWSESYNWSKLNNEAVEQHAAGDVLCFLNDDTRVLTPSWLEELVGAAIIPTVGAAGARLLYPHGMIQHVGVVAQFGQSGHIHKGLPGNNPGTNAYAITSHESTAVTGACMVVERAKFNRVGGFKEILAHNFNDVAFCLDLHRLGLPSVVCVGAELQHFEGVTRNEHGLTEDVQHKLHNDGMTLLNLYPEPDPYWNPNLVFTGVQNGTMLAGLDLATYIHPPLELPWGSPAKERILVIGSADVVAEERSNGAAIFQLATMGNLAQIYSPPMANCGPWDIRLPKVAAKAFSTLGIDRVIVSQLGESLTQLLAFVSQLNVPIEYRPLDAESVCPRGNLKPNGSMCDKGYATGKCQSCIDEYSSPHGNVIVPSYLAEWIRFINNVESVSLENLTDSSYHDALHTIYGGKPDV